MLAQITKKIGRTALLYTRGGFHTALVAPIVRQNPDIDFYLHTNFVSQSDYESSVLHTLANCHFVSNFDELKYKLDLFGAFITTDANAANAHQYSLRLVRLFNRMNVPVFEMQHGLFQLGLHYYDVPGSVGFEGDSLPTKTFADEVLLYYPPWRQDVHCTVVGYPPSAEETVRSPREKDYMLVLSNLHWKTYQDEECRRFFFSVYEYAEKHPDARFIWKLHHGEVKNKRSQTMIEEASRTFPIGASRIRFHHLDAELERLTLADLISGAKMAVSTVSTTLLDCELAGLPLVVFDSPSVKCLVDKLNRKSVFTGADDLERAIDGDRVPFKSGFLLPYDNKAFRRTFDSHYSVTKLSRRDFLDLAFACMQPLPSELRWQIQSFKADYDHKMRMLSEFNGHMERIGGAVAGEDAALLKLSGAVAGQDAKLSQVSGALDGQTRRLAELQEALAGQDSRLARVSDALDGQTRRLAGQGAVLATIQAANAEGSQAIKEVAARENEVLDGVKRLAAESDRLREAVVAQTRGAEQFVAEIQRCANELGNARDALHKRESEVAELRRQLGARTSEIKLLRERADSLARSQRSLQRSLDQERRAHRSAQTQLEDIRRRSFGNRCRRFGQACLPYGAVCAWMRMAYGSCEDKPLFFYSGVLKRAKRMVKFMLPYGLVRAFRVRRYGR